MPGNLKARYQGKVYTVRVCFDQPRCDALMAQFTDGIVEPGKSQGTTAEEKAFFLSELKRLARQ